MSVTVIHSTVAAGYRSYAIARSEDDHIEGWLRDDFAKTGPYACC
jgi:hypothetical protein